MGLEGAPTTKVEPGSFLVKKAAEFIPVTVYLQLRFRNHSSTQEQQQIDLGFKAISDWKQHHEDFDLGLTTRFSLNPQNIASRAILKRATLSQYLAARKDSLTSTKERVEADIAEYQSIQGLEGEGLDGLERKETKLIDDLDLTNYIARAVGITLP